MIPAASIVAWSRAVPWASNEQVEQDLLLSRLIVEIGTTSTAAPRRPRCGSRTPALGIREGLAQHHVRVADGLWRQHALRCCGPTTEFGVEPLDLQPCKLLQGRRHRVSASPASRSSRSCALLCPGGAGTARPPSWRDTRWGASLIERRPTPFRRSE